MGREQRSRVAREAAGLMTHFAVNKGKLIETGWLALAATAYPNGMTDEQRKQLRAAFFAGAHHLLASIMHTLDADREPTADDMRRMELIQHELNAFLQEYNDVVVTRYLLAMLPSPCPPVIAWDDAKVRGWRWCEVDYR